MPMENIPKFCVRWHTFLVKIPILLPLRQVEAWCFANIKDFSKTVGLSNICYTDRKKSLNT